MEEERVDVPLFNGGPSSTCPDIMHDPLFWESRHLFIRNEV